MALHLVGENIDRAKAHAAAQAGEMVTPWRGIYVDADDDVDHTVRQHAVRIAAYLYPRAYLSGASASSLGPTQDGRLFLSGRRNQRTRIRAIEIIQNEAPEGTSTIPVIVGDDLGEMHLTASSPTQRFLEAFRQRSEHASAIGPDLRRSMAQRLIDEHGDAKGAADAIWKLARATRWAKEAEAAEQYLLRNIEADPVTNKADLGLTVAWHGSVVGNLAHDGAEWRWQSSDAGGPALVRETRPGSLPPFIESLLPEGWLAKVLNERDERETLRSGSRYLSNVMIVSDVAELSALPEDVLDGRLANFSNDGSFTGSYLGPTRQTLEDSFQARLAELFNSESTPRLSGVQIKAPMFLRANGDLVPATDTPFTHILKPAGTNGFEHLPIVEWTCMNLARSAGFEVPEVALVSMPGGMAPALIVERFDIRRSANDTQRLAMEDFCSVLELPAKRKYEGTIERMARGLRPLSTDPTGDIETLFRRALFAWLIADGDMHLKNLALLKIAEAGDRHFTAVRFAPVYDVVTTRVFPGLETDRMALKMNGRDDKLTPSDFLALARTIDIPQGRAAILMAECARRLSNALPTLHLPAMEYKVGGSMVDRIREIVNERIQPFV